MVETDSYFENAKIINFDLIHNECRGDDLEFDRKYSQTLFKKKVERNILENHRYDFVSAAKRSESSDVNLEKDQVLSRYLKRKVYVFQVWKNVKKSVPLKIVNLYHF